jgi:hypothetical protein
VSPNRIMQVFESFFGMGGASGTFMVLMWHAVVWSIWTSQNDIIFYVGSSTIDNLVDKVKHSSWKWFLGKNPNSICSFLEWEMQLLLCWSNKAM